MKTSNVNSRKQRGFVAAGWLSLHQAVLDRGAEVDCYTPDFPDLGAKSYVHAELYQALIGRVLELANVDVAQYGSRAKLISRAIWRWVRLNARRDIPQHWRSLTDCRSLTALITDFKDWTYGKGVGGPHYTASDLPSVVRFGYWLYSEGELSECSPLVAIVWGLAFIGAARDIQFRCDRCKICFRRARPGEAHCDFHTQSIAIDMSRSEAYLRYRHGLRAHEIALKNPHISRFMFGTPVELIAEKRLALPDVLFPLRASIDDWSDELAALKSRLEESPRVVAVAGIGEFRAMPYELLVERLRKGIDPYSWSNTLWDSRVTQAELWLELEEGVSAGIRGKGRKTSAMVDRAIELVTSGYSKGQIASTLGVTPSAISQWIRRYPEFRTCLNKLSLNKSTS